MNSSSTRTLLATVIGVLCAWVLPPRSAESRFPGTSQASPNALLLEKNEGEARIWTNPPPGGFVLKVSPQNNGSRHLVLGTEDMAPGDDIPTHKHLGQDEILVIEKGTAHVHLGNQERDLHAGGIAFIPAYTWVAVKNNGPDTVSFVFVFSAPGFENLLRCESVPVNEKPTPLSLQQEEQCDHKGHVIYRDGPS